MSWPILPTEGAYTDVERNFIDNSPEGLWPDNQDSNFGQFRKVICDILQSNVDFLTVLSNELFPSTSDMYLWLWEQEVGLPILPAGLSLAQRRALVQSRRSWGPFTRTRRRNIVESFLQATFGTPFSLVPGGVPLDPGGVPLYGEPGSISSLYAIRENQATDNLATNGNFENNTTGWAVAGASTIATSSTQARWGTKSLKFTKGASGTTVDYAFTAPAAGQYTFSAWVFVPAGGTISSVILSSNGYTGSSAEIDGVADLALRDQWQRIVTTVTLAGGDLVGNVRFTIAGQAAAEIVYIDGFQIEHGSTANEFNDPEKTEFYYEVRIRSDHDPGAGLTRELKRITPSGILFDVLLVATP